MDEVVAQAHKGVVGTLHGVNNSQDLEQINWENMP